MACLVQIGSQFMHTLHIVPHAVAVDQVRAGMLGNAEHQARRHGLAHR